MTASDDVAEQVVRLRGVLQLTREQLAERCTEAGVPMTAAMLANIETGRRDSSNRRRRDVSVDELLAFARALNVAPLALLSATHDQEPRAVFTAEQWAVLTNLPRLDGPCQRSSS